MVVLEVLGAGKYFQSWEKAKAKEIESLNSLAGEFDSTPEERPNKAPSLSLPRFLGA